MAEIATGDSEEALDIVQDAMLKLAEKYHHKQPQEWRFLFFKILQTRITDWHRRRKVRSVVSRFVDALGGRQSEHEGADSFPSPTFLQPDQVVLRDLEIDALKSALGRLPFRQQQAFLLRVWEGFDVRDTAKAMSCSEGSVKTHYSRALSALRRQLGEKP